MGRNIGSRRFVERLGRNLLVVGSALLLMAVTFRPSFSNPGYLAAFNAQYGTALTDKFGCQVCHTSPPALNSYGNDYLYSGHDLSAIEFLDSDGDEFTNIAEINAIANPGDPASHPAGDPHASPPVATGSAIPSTSASLTAPAAALHGAEEP